MMLDSLKTRMPPRLRSTIRSLRREARGAINRLRPTHAVFEDIYRNNRWGGNPGEFYSGPGSTGAAAQIYVKGIKDFIQDNGVTTIVDLGCGDFRVAQQFVGSESCAHYTGVDVVQSVIGRNLTLYSCRNVTFQTLDITEDPLPPGELCLIREVFQHLSNAEILQILPKLTQYRYVIYSDCQPSPVARCIPNLDIAHGTDTRIWRNSALFLEMEPFLIPTTLLFDAPVDEITCQPGERIRSYLLHAAAARHSTAPIRLRYLGTPGDRYDHQEEAP